MSGLFISIIAGIIVALIICFALKGQLKNNHEASLAMQYLDDDSVKYSIRKDAFSHKTVDRQKINKD